MNNQIIVVVGSDGRIIYTEQDGVFRRSNKQNELVALLQYPNTSVVKVNFIRADGVKPSSQYMTWTGEQEYEGANYYAYSYFLSDYQLYATGPLVASLDIITGAVTVTSGDFTIDVEASEGPCGAETPSDPNKYDEALKVLMHTDAVLIDRTQNVPNLVASIQKVEGADNAFTYTDNSGVTSAPIVLGEGGETPTLSNNASRVTVPETAWVAQYDGVNITGYTYVITAGLHGQMRDGATANDLWVSFDEGAENLGAYSRYTVDESGDITVYVNEPVAMAVRVWNGKGGYDGSAREAIAAETARAEATEQNLQSQITELQNTGVDEVAREAVAAETARAEAREEELHNEIVAETNRAEQAEEALQNAINVETARAKEAENNLQDAITQRIGTEYFFHSPLVKPAWVDTPAAKAYLGSYCITIEVPANKRIIQVFEAAAVLGGGYINYTPRGTWYENIVYANAPFNGVAIIV